MSFIPKPHEIYKHFKGNLYQITAVAEHTETGEQLVIYQALYGDYRTYARPLDMFVSRVDRDKYPDVEQEFRFELQGPDAGRQREESVSRSSEGGNEESDRRSGTEKEQTGSRSAASENETERAIPVKPGNRPALAGTLMEAEQAEEQKSSCVSENCGQLSEGELALDPMVLEFLDADDYAQRLNILAGLHHRITDDMITTMAIASDVEIGDGDIEERYEALKTCLLTLERYECNRIR